MGVIAVHDLLASFELLHAYSCAYFLDYMLSVALNHRHLWDPVSKSHFIIFGALFWWFLRNFFQIHIPDILVIDPLEFRSLLELFREVFQFIFHRRHLRFLKGHETLKCFIQIRSIWDPIHWFSSLWDVHTGCSFMRGSSTVVDPWADKGRLIYWQSFALFHLFQHKLRILQISLNFLNSHELLCSFMIIYIDALLRESGYRWCRDLWGPLPMRWLECRHSQALRTECFL